MNEYQAALTIGACVIGLVSLGDKRALIWLAVGAANFAATSIYYHVDPAMHPFVAALVDAFVCILIDIYGWHRWELSLWRVFQAMVLVNLLSFIGVIPDHTFQAIVLEALNWLALVVIGGPRLMRHVDGLVGKMAPGSAAHRAVHRAVHSLYAKRGRFAFWSAPRG